MVSAQKQIEEVLSGSAPHSGLSTALKSAIRLPIYTRACAVLADPTRAERRAKLNAEPESIRALVEAEALRLHKLRSNNA